MTIGKIRATQSEVSQKFNLKRIFGLKESQDFPGGIAQAIGQAMIDKIRERTLDGRGLDGNNFAASSYDPEYRASLKFKAFKGRKRKPDLKLTGDMLASIDILETDPEDLTIGIDGDEAPKAYNHQVGDTLPQREFFGLTSDDVEDIRVEFQDAVNKQAGIPESRTAQTVLNAILALEERERNVEGAPRTTVGALFSAIFDPEA